MENESFKSCRIIRIFQIYLTFFVAFQAIASAEEHYRQFVGNVVGVGKAENAILAQANPFTYRHLTPKKLDTKATDEFVYKEVTTTDGGQLSGLLGDEIYEIDSLVVKGKVNDEDFNTMWSGTFYGKLKVINLKESTIDGDRLPKNAFWHQSEQLSDDWTSIYTIWLERIILPEGLREIGYGAFSYATSLKYVNIPSTLQLVDTYAFSDCISLSTNPLIFPEGFTRIGNLAFMVSYVASNNYLKEIILPSTIIEIGDGAFFQKHITSCNLPEGLEVLGDAAFYSNSLKEVIVPNTCKMIGTDHFSMNYELENLHLPDGMSEIPNGLCNNCIKLKAVNIPKTVKNIGDYAFWQCMSLENLDLPEVLDSIGYVTLYDCKSLQRVVIPSSVRYLGGESCSQWKNVKDIYCMATIPPACSDSPANPGTTPFGSYGDTFELRTPQDTPVYVPYGTSNAYKAAWGWNYFTNFIETDDFPSSVIEVSSNNNFAKDVTIYDLMGRKTSHVIDGQIYIQNGMKCCK